MGGRRRTSGEAAVILFLSWVILFSWALGPVPIWLPWNQWTIFLANFVYYLLLKGLPA